MKDRCHRWLSRSNGVRVSRLSRSDEPRPVRRTSCGTTTRRLACTPRSLWKCVGREPSDTSFSSGQAAIFSPVIRSNTQSLGIVHRTISRIHRVWASFTVRVWASFTVRSVRSPSILRLLSVVWSKMWMLMGCGRLRRRRWRAGGLREIDHNNL